MAPKRTVGYVQLEWTCPNCSSRNPGPAKTCQNCGAPQPENVQFERAGQEKLITDEKQIEAAAAGADIHCAFCGARNPATAKVCSQCGADLTEGKARSAGRELQAAATASTVTCTNCGTENPASKTICAKCGAPLPRAQAASQGAPSAVSFGAPMGGSEAAAPSSARPARKVNWLLWGGLAATLLVLCIAGLFVYLVPSSSVQGTVADVHWQTSVPLQEQQEVRYNDRAGRPPGDAYDVSCRSEARQLCEQKTVDKGNGYGEVVEECHDESTDYCSYTIREWQTIQTFTQEGSDLVPMYASPNISTDQRAGSPSEDLTVSFETEKGQLNYSPDTVAEYQQFQVGSVWTLKLNALGGIVGLER